MFGQLLPVALGLRESAFCRVSQKTALDEHRWNCRPAQNEESAAPNSPVFRRRAGNDVPVNARRQARAIAPVIVGFDAVGASARRTIEMNGDESRVAIRVSDRHPRSQRNENILIASHDHSVTVGLQDAPQAERDVEGLVFLGNALTGNTSAIVAPVTGINYNRRTRLTADERGAHHETRDGRDGNKPVKIH